MATIPETHRVFRQALGKGTPEKPLPLELKTEKTLPDGGQLDPHDVLIRIRAVSLNFRDIIMLVGQYMVPTTEGVVPTSDCAAEVVSLGSGVTDFEVGDRVAPIFGMVNITGKEENFFTATLGGDLDGVLREYAVFEDRVLVHLPKNLTWEEAATINCAGCTAWNALKAPGSFDQDKTVLLQGTGGVSMFALLIALAGGIKPIITSSSDQKLAAINKLAPDGKILTYNYKSSPDQVAAVKALTGGKGVDIVLNNAGPQSIPADIGSLCRYGSVMVVGRLDRSTTDWDPLTLYGLIPINGSINGIAAGSKTDFEALNAFIEEKGIRLEPLVDRVFDFEDSQAAFDYLREGKHVGKVVIKI